MRRSWKVWGVGLVVLGTVACGIKAPPRPPAPPPPPASEAPTPADTSRGPHPPSAPPPDSGKP